MTIIHSSDLGWTAGQDISQEFAALAKTLQPGDTFVFDAMYDISGTDIELTNNVTLKGGTPGAGFNVTDTQTNSSPLIDLADGCSLVDLTVTHSNSSTARTQKVTFKVDADDVTIMNSSFSGNTGIFLDITGDDLLVQDTHFDGGFYQMRWLGDTNNFIVKNTLFENSLGDGIKTARGGGEGTKNATIIDSVFLNNHRDGIDTTGGFKNSSVIDSYFVGNGVSGMDIKTPIWESADLSLNQTSRNVTITGTEFIDNGAGIVLTTNDRAQLLTDSNANDWLVQDIFISDTVFENHSSANSVMVLSKGATGVYADNVTLLGTLHTYKTVEHNYIDHLNIDVNTNLNLTNSTTGDPRSSSLNIDYAAMAGPNWSAVSDVTPDPVVTPTPDPDPVVTPTPDPDPVDDNIFTPPPGEAPMTTNSDLLNIFFAATDTDENLAMIGATNQIDSADIEGRKLTIYATSKDGAPSIGSVKLDVEGFGARIENVAPYAMFGDNNGDLKGGKIIPVGDYSGTITVYSGANGKGTILETTSFNYSVNQAGGTSNPVTPPQPAPDPIIIPEPIPEPNLDPETNIDMQVFGTSNLLNAYIAFSDTDVVISEIGGKSIIARDEIGNRKLTVFASSKDDATSIGSVKLEGSSFGSRLENVEPYAMFGDSNGNLLGGKRLDDGTHFVTLTAYSGRNGKGSVLEKVTLEFTIGDYDQVLIDGTLQPIDSYSSEQDKGVALVSSDMTAIELMSNSWKTVEIDKTITKDTVLNIDFQSDTEGEIHGIGFSNGGDVLSNTFFQLHGIQSLGHQDFNDQYASGSGVQNYNIPIGDFFTGDFDSMILITDDDMGMGANSIFSNIDFVELA